MSAGWDGWLVRGGIGWGGERTYGLSGEGENECCARRDVGEYREGGVADQTAGHALDGGCVDG